MKFNLDKFEKLDICGLLSVNGGGNCSSSSSYGSGSSAVSSSCISGVGSSVTSNDPSGKNSSVVEIISGSCSGIF